MFAMPSIPGDIEDDSVCVAGRVNAVKEDRYWSQAHRRERYYSARYDYEDFAPAYCVGYVGFAQYGGSYEEAEKSLCANWERIKGGSCLPLDIARLAIRAAWDRMSQARERAAVRSGHGRKRAPRRMRMYSASVSAPAMPLQ